MPDREIKCFIWLSTLLLRAKLWSVSVHVLALWYHWFHTTSLSGNSEKCWGCSSKCVKTTIKSFIVFVIIHQCFWYLTLALNIITGSVQASNKQNLGWRMIALLDFDIDSTFEASALLNRDFVNWMSMLIFSCMQQHSILVIGLEYSEYSKTLDLEFKRRKWEGC